MRISNASPSSFSVQIHDSVVCLRSLSEVQQKEKHIYCIPSVLVNNLVLRCYLRDVKVDALGALQCIGYM